MSLAEFSEGADTTLELESSVEPFLAQYRRMMRWSFEEARPRIAKRLREVTSPPIEPTRLTNDGGQPTGIAQGVTVPQIGPTQAPRFDFGRRRSFSLQRWEGVVEEVSNSGFTARLSPEADGANTKETIEYTDFTWEEITDADRELVKPNAVFYWTIARRANEAGTQTNESLVRFRRVPPLSEYHERIARDEALELLRDLGAPES